MRIHYISYGTAMTGGYRHEKTLFTALYDYLTVNGPVNAWEYRKQKLFRTWFAYLELFLWSYFRSHADINIVTARSGIAAMLRNLFNNKQVWIVLHNYDETDGKSALLRWYYARMFSMLRKARHKRFKVITVAPFWVRFFKDHVAIENTYLFPNLFDPSVYEDFKQSHKNPWIHLGQYSSKNDRNISLLANTLGQEGYYCYFSTLHEAEAMEHNGHYEILFFPEFADYLNHMSHSCCTLALTRINEGWNRIAHESILVGTPVIGYDKGGLGDLLKESNSISVKNINEALTCIRESLWVIPDSSFIKKYDIRNASAWLEPICKA